MAYTTEAIVREESPYKDNTKIVSAYVTRAIAQADSFIDGYIGVRYSLPLDSTPSIIQDLSTQLAVYFLYTDQNTNIEIASGVDVEGAKADVVDILEAIRDGKLHLYDTSGDEYGLRSTAKPTGYPTATSTAAEDTPALFEIDKKY